MNLVYDPKLIILSKMSLDYWIEYNLVGVPKVTDNNFSKKRV